MTVVVITPPSAVVSLEQAKKHCKVELSETYDDVLISAYIDAATAWLDGPSGWLGRALGMQILELQLCEWPSNPVTLPFPPTIEVLSIAYVDPDGAEQTLDVPDPLWFENMPAVRGRPGDVKIRYRAGYATVAAGEPPVWTNAAPAPIEVAMLMLVAHWYENREAVQIDSTAVELPFAVEALLSPYRVWWF